MATLAANGQQAKNIICRGGCLAPYSCRCQAGCERVIHAGEPVVLLYVADEDAAYRGECLIACRECAEGGAA